MMRYGTLILTAGLLLCGLATSRALAEPAAETPPWTAQWIGLEAPDAPDAANQWFSFRHAIDLAEVPATAPARIAVDSKYWLWINGNLVVFDGQLKRGPTPQDTYYDTIDLAPYLQPGRNTLAILVWYFGRDGFSHKSSGRPGLVFEMQAGSRTIVSDGAWKVTRHPAFGGTGAPETNFRLSESNIRFDARKDLGDWQAPAYDDSAWTAAQTYGAPPAAPWNRLVARPIPMMKDYGLTHFISTVKEDAGASGTLMIARLPYDAQTTPYFKIEAPAGLTIDIRTDAYALFKDIWMARAEYVTRAGVQEFELPGWLSGLAYHFTFPKGVKVLDLQYRETGYDTNFAGHFRCDVPFYNQLWQDALRTLYVTMRDTYMDCPDRERAQWWGDMVNELGEAFYALDTRSHALARKGILELMKWHRPDGSIRSPIPGVYDAELPMQMLNSVGFYGFWTYYFYSGDKATLAEVYPETRRYLLDVWTLAEDGLVTQRKGEWTWMDWGKNMDGPVLYNCWYALALQGLRNTAELTGHGEDLPEIDRRLASLHEHFNAAFWNNGVYRSKDHKGVTDDRANALALLSGLSTPAQADGILTVLTTSYEASPYMEKYVLEALYRLGQPTLALERMRKRYQSMIDGGTGTLWENFGNSGTYNHGWSGGPLTLLSQYSAGIAPTTPAFATFQIMPQMGTLRWIRATVPTVRGTIEVALQREAQRFTLETTVPETTRATAGIPADALPAITQIKLNGQLVWNRGKLLELPAGVKALGLIDGYYRYELPAGSWMLTAFGN